MPKYVRAFGVALIAALILLVGTHAENDQVTATILKPEQGEEVGGLVEIIAQGEGFKVCDSASFSYSIDQEAYEGIGDKIRATDATQIYRCIFQTDWDTTQLSPGKYYIKVEITGILEGGWFKTVSAEIYVDVVEVPLPGVPKAKIIKPQDGATLERGQVEIEAEGIDFDSCSSADLRYKRGQEGYNGIISEVKPISNCAFHASWDITDPAEFPDDIYYLQVIIYGRKGGQDTQASAEIKVTIGPIMPAELNADFDWEPQMPTTRDNVVFRNRSSPKPCRAEPDLEHCIKQFKWEFGDGTIDYGTVVRHRYVEEGQYSIKLTVTDNKDQVDSKTKSITVKPFKAISASRVIEAFPPLSSEAYPQSLPGDLMRVIVRIEINIAVIAIGLDEDPPWEITAWDWRIQPSGTRVHAQFKRPTADWIFTGEIAAGSAITVAYYLLVPEDAEIKDYNFWGWVSTGNESPEKPNVMGDQHLSVVDALPIKVVIAHIKGEGCGADFPDKCEVDPLDDNLIDARQIEIAEDFWKEEVPVPRSKEVINNTMQQPGYITSQIMLQLICYYEHQLPITEQSCPVSTSVAGVRPPEVSVSRKITAFPPLPPESLDQILPSHPFQVEVDIHVLQPTSVLILDEDPPYTWEVIAPLRWDVQPPDTRIHCSFKKPTIEWLCTGPIPASSTVTMTYQLHVPQTASRKAYPIIGRVFRDGAPEITVPDSWVRVVDTLPLKEVIAYITGDGCGADMPNKCEVDALSEDPFIDAKQLAIAKDFWEKEVPVPYATKPALITSQAMLELMCYEENHIPVTEPCPATGTEPPVSEQPPAGEEVGLLPLKVVIAHIKGINCSASSPEQCEIDALDDDLIDARQLSVAEDFWENHVPVPQAMGPERGQPAYIDFKTMLELACYHVRQVPVTEPACPAAGEEFVASASRTISIFPPLPPETWPQVLPGNLLQVKVIVEAATDAPAIGLDEDLPEGWAARGREWKIQPAEVPMHSSFKHSVTEWIFTGPIPIGSTIIVSYFLNVPGNEPVDTLKSIKGWVSNGPTEIQVLGDSEFKVVDALPIKMVIAHVTGEGCGADSPDRCAVDPTLDNLINEEQIKIAEGFWQNDVPVPKAFGPEGEQPAYITYEVYLELFCYYQNELPVTQPSCP